MRIICHWASSMMKYRNKLDSERPWTNFQIDFSINFEMRILNWWRQFSHLVDFMSSLVAFRPFLNPLWDSQLLKAIEFSTWEFQIKCLAKGGQLCRVAMWPKRVTGPPLELTYCWYGSKLFELPHHTFDNLSTHWIEGLIWRKNFGTDNIFSTLVLK